MNPLTRRATLRHADIIERRKSPFVRFAKRFNPALVVGTVLAACGIWLAVSAVVASASVAERQCWPSKLPSVVSA